MLTQAKNIALVSAAISRYWARYFSCRRFPDGQLYYVVYTEADDAIPYQASVGNYWTINLHLMASTLRIADQITAASFANVRRAYLGMASEAKAAWREAPTIMPRFDLPCGGPLRLTQSLLKPINCSPSLHAAVPFFLYNMAVRYRPEEAPRLASYVGEVVSTVLRTKLHAMIDIAFGMLLAKNAVEEMGFLFHDPYQQRLDGIPYEQAYRHYRAVKDSKAPLPLVMKRYFQKIGLPQVRREDSACFYEVETATLHYLPGSRNGRGLF